MFEELDGATGATLRKVPVPFTADIGSTVVAGDLIAYMALNPVSGKAQVVVQSRTTFGVLWTADLTSPVLVPLPLVIADNLLYEPDVDSAGNWVLRAFLASGCGPATCPPV